MSAAKVGLKRPRLLLILDLNGTLMYRSKEYNEKLIKVQDSFKINSLKVLMRPGFPSFGTYIMDNFDVAVWTSAMVQNAQKLVTGASAFCPSFSIDSLAFMYDREKCTLTEWTGEEYERRKAASKRKFVKPLASKNLEQVWKDFNGKFNAKNTVFIDDSCEKMVQPENHICIPEFLNHKRCENDVWLDKLVDYLKKMNEWYQDERQDVRDFLKENQFYSPTTEEALPMEALKLDNE